MIINFLISFSKYYFLIDYPRNQNKWKVFYAYTTFIINKDKLF